MRTAETILNIIQDRGKRQLPLDDVYRQLYNPAMYLRAYARLYKNDGAMTPGMTEETVDDMSTDKIAKIIEAIRYERWKWTPVRRKNIPKRKGGTRPLGMPTWSDKVVQDVIRSILEAYYEPQFSQHSHGFRPKKGCQTALIDIHETWTGTKWFIEGDIKGCYDNLDHHILMNRCSPANTLKIEKPTLQLGLHMNNPTEGLAYEETPRLGPTVPQPRLLPVQSYA
jgi:retron-type reverse transcriptase